MKLITAIIVLILGIFGPLFMHQQLPLNKAVMPQSVCEKSLSIAGWLPYWDKARANEAFAKNIKLFDEVSPYWYSMKANGDIERLDSNTLIVRLAKKHRIKVIPMISNDFDGQMVNRIINNSALRKYHIDKIVRAVNKNGHDGIEIDYEGLLATDRHAFNVFVEELAAALHKHNKLLSVTLMAKVKEPGQNSTTKAQDWKTLGKYADRLRIMAYDYHWKTSAPGPIAPYSWVRKVIRFAVTQIPAGKTVLGVGTYGYHWGGGRAKGVDYQNINRKNYKRDPRSKELFSKDKATWVQDSVALKHKVQLVKNYNLRGIALWRVGGEDPGNWKVLSAMR